MSVTFRNPRRVPGAAGLPLLLAFAAPFRPSGQAAAQSADPPVATVSGRVTTAPGATPLPDAVVTVGGTSFAAQTDSTGVYRLQRVPSGQRTKI